MNCWKILSIEETDETALIKKAYAKQLKLHHPEDDPEGFQIIKEAYKEALKIVKTNKVHIENKSIEKEEVNLNKIEQNIHYKNVNFEDKKLDLNMERKRKMIEEVFQSVARVYNNMESRVEIQYWQEILDRDIMWDLNYKETINYRMLDFLSGHKYLPKNIWMLLNSYFNFEEQSRSIAVTYDEAFVRHMFNEIENQSVLRYCYFDNHKDIAYEEYLKYREEAFNGIKKGQLEKARKYIDYAYDIYKNDPDLLCIRGEYYLKIRKNRLAKKQFKEAININPRDMETRFLMAESLFRGGQIHCAIGQCKKIIAKEGNSFKVNILLGKSYFYLGKLSLATNAFVFSIKENEASTEARSYLVKISNILLSKLKNNPFDFKVRSKLKLIYELLGEKNYQDKMKIKGKEYFNILKKILILIIIFGIIIGTRGAGIIILIGKYLIETIKNR